METKTNTGLGLIEDVIHRARHSTFYMSVLKKIQNMTDEDLRKKLFAGQANPVFLIHSIKSIRKGIKKGNYDWIYNYITEGEENRELIKRLEKRDVPKEIEVELVHFNKSISTRDALKELDKMGYRPATPQELLAFGAEYPEEQKKHSITALPTQEEIDNDSVFRSDGGDRRALCLYWFGAARNLRLAWLENDWPASWRFLVARK